MPYLNYHGIRKIDIVVITHEDYDHCGALEELKNYINFGRVGISSLFAVLYSMFEILSIFKNMMRCKIPLPSKLQKLIYKLLNKLIS